MDGRARERFAGGAVGGRRRLQANKQQSSPRFPLEAGVCGVEAEGRGERFGRGVLQLGRAQARLSWVTCRR